MLLEPLTIPAAFMLLKENSAVDAYSGIYLKEGGDPPVRDRAIFNADGLPNGLMYLYKNCSDCYWTVNSYKYENEHGFRKEENLRSLDFFYVDIDCGREGSISLKEAFQKVHKAYNENRIPRPTIIVCSGRGLYLLWRVKPFAGYSYQPALEKNIYWYKRINAGLQNALRQDCTLSVYVDTPLDAARFLRIPNSVNSNNDKSVQYYTLDPEAEYSMDEMRDFLGIKDGKSAPKKNVKSCPQRSPHPMWLRRYLDILVIGKYLPFPHGKRRKLLTWAINCGRMGRRNEVDLRADVSELAESCSPSYPSDKSDSSLHELLKSTQNTTIKIRDSTLAEKFGVTFEIADELGLQQIRPTKVKAEKEDKYADIDLFITEHISESNRNLETLIEEELNQKVSYGTIRRRKIILIQKDKSL